MNQRLSPSDGKNPNSMLNSIWDEIGYSQEEKDEGIRKINAEIEKVRSKFIESTLKQCQKVIEDTEKIRSNHISMLKAMNAPEDKIKEVKENGRNGTIKEKYEDVKSKFKEFSRIYDQRYEEFENLQKQINSCYSAIGINDPSQKGEFAEIGEDDLTQERLRRYEEKITQLSNEVDSRLLQFNSFKKKILSINYDLQEDLPKEIEDIFTKQVYSDQALESLKEYHSELKELLNSRSQFVSEMAVEINRLWDLLSVNELTRREFLASHNTLSQKNIQDCIDEADRLTKIRNKNLPDIIDKMKLDLSKICQSLGYSEEKENEIINKCEQINESSINQSEEAGQNGNQKCDDEFCLNKEEEEEKLNPMNENQKRSSLKDFSDERNQKERNQEEEEIQMERNQEEEENQKERNQEEEEENQKERNQEEEEENQKEKNQEEEEENQRERKQEQKGEENLKDEEKDQNERNQEEEESQNERNKEEENGENDDFDKNLQIFNNLNSELLKLRKTLIFAQPIIELINQREQIINDYNEVMNKPEKTTDLADKQYDPDAIKIRRVDQLNGKGIKFKHHRVQIPDHKEKLRSEKVVRRHKFVLPRIEKKLKIMLIQYKEEQNEDFIWKEKPIINELDNIQVTPDEINQNRVRFNRIKKKMDANNDTDIDGDTDKSAVKHRKSLFVNRDKIEPKNDTGGSNNRKSRKTAFPKKLKKIIADD